jgi:hypothetical protein
MSTIKTLAAGLAAAFTLLSVAPAAAQTEGRVGVGGSVTLNANVGGNRANALAIGPLIRLNPRRGWGVAAALNWFHADLNQPDGGEGPFGRLTIKPLMAGVGYTFGPDRTLFNVSVVGGPSFNSARFQDEYIERISSLPTIEADNSLAIRPGFSITHTLAPRVGLTGFAGYLFNRPKVVYRNADMAIDDHWNADSVVLSVGLVYSIF